MLIKFPFVSAISGIFCTSSAILTFLCLFAGSRKGFLDDYAILTLNTSQIHLDLSHGLLSNTPLTRRFNPVASVARAMTTAEVDSHFPTVTGGPHISHIVGSGRPKLTAAIESAGRAAASSVQSGLNHAEGDLAEKLGIHDFYSAHLLTFCEGDFMPRSRPDVPVPNNSISKIVTSCSSCSVKQVFEPQSILQQQLGVGGVDLTNSGWPDQLDSGFTDLRSAQRAAVVLYVLSLVFMLLALLLTMANACCCNTAIWGSLITLAEWAAVVPLGLAAAMVTTVAVKGSDLINTYGGIIGVSATAGVQFVALTWVAWAAIVIAAFV